jgi:DNA-binding LytR/AlgR family response regulator
MFKIAICDDEVIICSLIESIILKYKQDTHIDIEVEVFYSGEEIFKYLEDFYFDLIYLDIEMQKLNGIQIGKMIREQMENYATSIVYISGKDSYYKQLFDVQPLNFIEKPIQSGKIIDTLALALKLTDKFSKTFTYKKGYNIHKIQIKDIIYFESLEREIKIVTIKGIEKFYGKLEEVYEQLKKYLFMHIHRSYIINYTYVKVFKYTDVIMFNNEKLPISQSKRKIIREEQLKYALEGNV